jgi:hypothetical protein
MRSFLLLAFAVTCSAGCGRLPVGLTPDVADVLRHADEFGLYSLDASPDVPADGESFHGHAVLGKLAVPPGKDRDWITANIDRGLVEKPERTVTRLGTRHGLRARRGEEVIDLVFDYGTYTVTIVTAGRTTTRPTSHTPMGLIEKTLFDAKVPLAGVSRR